jgi:hypothetical protein
VSPDVVLRPRAGWFNNALFFLCRKSEEKKETDSEGESSEDEGGDKEHVLKRASEFRMTAAHGRQFAFLMDADKEKVAFMIGDVCKGEKAGDEEVLVHWFSPAALSSGVRGKWTPDFVKEKSKLVPWIEKRSRQNIIPVKVEWTAAGFTTSKGGRLTPMCVGKLEDWIEIYEAQEAEQEAERAASGEGDMKPSGKRQKVANTVT